MNQSTKYCNTTNHIIAYKRKLEFMYAYENMGQGELVYL